MPDPTPSARAFADALKHPDYGPKIRGRIHRVSISRFIHGVRRPGIDTAKWLEDITEGAVSVGGWSRELAPIEVPDAEPEKGAA